MSERPTVEPWVIELWSSPWCSSCREWERVLETLTGPGVTLVRRSITDDRALALEQRVAGAPTILVRCGQTERLRLREWRELPALRALLAGHAS